MSTNHIRAIDRFFSHADEDWEVIKKDLKPLVKLINNSNEEYNLQIRQDCFNIYYQGSSVAQITPKTKSRTYTVKIHKKFLTDDMYKKLEACSLSQRLNKEYVSFNIQSDKLHRFFQRHVITTSPGASTRLFREKPVSWPVSFSLFPRSLKYF